MPAQCETLQVQISDDEHALLEDAYWNWNDAHTFSDEKVREVKQIFQRVFDDGSEMSGTLYGDALVLKPDNNASRYYAMVIIGDSMEWKRALITATNFQVTHELIPFEDFLMIAGSYCAPILDDPDLSKCLLYDFFKYWQRKYSNSRIKRVSQAGEIKRSTTDTIPQNNSTLQRMQWELRMLGFQNHANDTYISAEWIDPEKEQLGCAPQSFTISLSSDDDPGCVTGVFIDETYGRATIPVQRWDEWDAFLHSMMRPVV
jgi:hypothetical protein